MKAGSVALVGAGPGDAELLTVKACNAIREADLILYDRLVSKEVLSIASRRTEMRYVGKSADGFHTNQATINRAMLKGARAGKKVVRLKNGDPFIFGRGGEEADFLRKRRIPFEVVPGISSALAAPLVAGIPLTHRMLSSSVAIVPGHECHKGAARTVALEKISATVDTIVILMGMRNLETIVEKLVKGGKDRNTDVAIVEWATTRRERVIPGTLGSIVGLAKKHGAKAPAVIVVGRVARHSLAGKFQKRLPSKRYSLRARFGDRTSAGAKANFNTV